MTSNNEETKKIPNSQLNRFIELLACSLQSINMVINWYKNQFKISKLMLYKVKINVDRHVPELFQASLRACTVS